MGNGIRVLGARLIRFVISAAVVAGIAAPAAAEWKVYTSADLGFSIAEADGSGEVRSPVNTFTLAGDDNDVSPFLGGALGLAVPFGELTPWATPRWLSNFALREEVEVIGLRNYKFTTDAPELGGLPVVGLGKVQTEVDMWTVMVNTWLDVPLDGLYRPISWTSARLFGQWRLRTLKQILERTTISGGVGIGATFLEVETNQDGSSGNEKTDDFAWQAGAGIGYQLNDRVNLSLGYRYIDPGSVDVGLSGDGLSTTGGSFELDPEIHEARATVRLDFFGFTSPWHLVSGR